jgi:hypothetical protein
VAIYEMSSSSTLAAASMKAKPDRSITCTTFLTRKEEHLQADNHADIVICAFRRPGLSADDRRIAVLNSAFEAFSGVLRQFRASWAKPSPPSACDGAHHSMNKRIAPVNEKAPELRQFQCFSKTTGHTNGFQTLKRFKYKRHSSKSLSYLYPATMP